VGSRAFPGRLAQVFATIIPVLLKLNKTDVYFLLRSHLCVPKSLVSRHAEVRSGAKLYKASREGTVSLVGNSVGVEVAREASACRYRFTSLRLSARGKETLLSALTLYSTGSIGISVLCLRSRSTCLGLGFQVNWVDIKHGVPASSLVGTSTGETAGTPDTKSVLFWCL
jgi:hypothetical protein